MRAPRWALVLVSAAAVVTTVGAGMAVLTPTAKADAPVSRTSAESRWEASAQGDSQYYELFGKGLPLSPDNSSGSLTTHGFADDTGATTAFAGAPYFGNGAQHAPGTINGVLTSDGYGQVQFPFTRLPQYIELSGAGQRKSEEGGYYRIAAATDTDHAEASGARGAPAAIPAPNQQETSTASVQRTADGTVVSKAEGTDAGFVMGDLEVGRSVASAVVTDVTGDRTPQIKGNSFGRFTIAGLQFGFDSDRGFFYAGQAMSQEEALGSLNAALKAIGVQLDILRGTSTVDEVSGATRYLIGGLRITTTQDIPGTGLVTLIYTLGRAEITTVNKAIAFDSAPSPIRTGLAAARENRAAPRRAT